MGSKPALYLPRPALSTTLLCSVKSACSFLHEAIPLSPHSQSQIASYASWLVDASLPIGFATALGLHMLASMRQTFSTHQLAWSSQHRGVEWQVSWGRDNMIFWGMLPSQVCGPLSHGPLPSPPDKVAKRLETQNTSWISNQIRFQSLVWCILMLDFRWFQFPNILFSDRPTPRAPDHHLRPRPSLPAVPAGPLGGSYRSPSAVISGAPSAILPGADKIWDDRCWEILWRWPSGKLT